MNKPNVDWGAIAAQSDRDKALQLFAEIAEERCYGLMLSPKKYVKGKPVEYCATALPHGANQKPIKGEGLTPELAIFDLVNNLTDRRTQ